MINHARTLLLNRRGGSQNLAELGAEYIPVEFRGLSLPPWLQTLWGVLFGARPDNVYANYVVDQLLTTTHATEYEPYLLLHDPRITYDPTRSSAFADAAYKLEGSFTQRVTELSLVGSPQADDAQGLMNFVYRVTMTNGTATVVNLRSQVEITMYVHRSSVVSETLELPGANTSIRLTLNTSTLADWDTEGTVRLLTRPQRTLAERIADADRLRGDFERNLFGTQAQEPYITFYGLWTQAASFPERVAGLTLALVYRMHRMYFDNA